MHHHHYTIANAICIFLTLATLSANAVEYTVLVKPNEHLNLRQRATVASPKVGEAYLGDVLDGERAAKGWIVTEDGGHETALAYVNTDYLTTDSVTILDHAVKYRVTKNKVAMRTKPGGRRIAWANKGDVVTAIATLPGAVYTDNGECISTDFLEEVR